MVKRRLINLALPVNSRRRRLAKKYLSHSPATTIDYDSWIKTIEPKLWSQNVQLKTHPLISVVTPAFNTPDKYIKPLIESLLSQKYSNWELCIADASTTDERSLAIKKLCDSDSRFIYKKLKQNYGIVGNTNAAIKAAKGEFIGFLDHDDLLSPHALWEVVVAINRDPKVDLLYSDEDKLSDDGKTRLLPFFKPDWSPEMLLGVNYITHFTVVRKALSEKLNNLRAGFDGSQDYDFLLRATERTNNIVHIPKVLYHWRQAAGSTAIVPGEKNYADSAGRRALSDAIKRRSIEAEVLEIPDRPTNYRLRYKLPAKQPLVSIIIPFKDKADLLEQCVSSILNKTTYKNYEILLISNNSTEAKTKNYLARLSDSKKIKKHEWNKPFNYAALNNFGATKASGEYLVLLNNDTEVITDSWLEELFGVASQAEIGVVGPLLLYPDKTIQHAGVILGMMGMAGHVFRHRLPGDWTDFGLPLWPRDYLAVTGACLVVKKSKYDKVGGLDEKFVVAGNDVALGIKLNEAGYRNVYWPFAELMHHENSSVGSYASAPSGDYEHSLAYYQPYLDNGDPFFNPNLDLMNEHIGLRKNYG